MTEKPGSLKDLVDRSKEMAREQILATVKARFFPEIWYIVENWFSTTKVDAALEVGFGIGLVGEAMARSGMRVTVVDPSRRALNELAARFAKSGAKAEFAEGAFEHLPFPDQTFDVVACINALELAASPDAAMKEIARVLKPGGRAVVAAFNKHSPWGLPSVSNAIRGGIADPSGRPSRSLGKEEFLALFKGKGLKVESLKERAAFLPVGPKLVKLKLPVPGAFVALVRPARIKSQVPQADLANTAAADEALNKTN